MLLFEHYDNGSLSLSINGVEAFRKQAEAAANYFKERTQKINSLEFKEQEIQVEIDYKAVLAVDLSETLKKGDLN